MGEALIVSRGGGSGSKSSKILKTEVITESKQWYKPANIVNNEVSVRLFGAGGGSKSISQLCAGGGGGYMKNSIINISNYSSIPITIGTGTNTNGGTTSFGLLLAANGGSCTNAESPYGYGGNGGCGGSGGGAVGTSNYGGIGYQFGGGGSVGNNMNPRPGSCGGKWGGGGGGVWNSTRQGGCLYENASNALQITGYSGLNKTNTIGMGLEFEGPGTDGSTNNYTYGGGGGYGGKGGDGKYTWNSLRSWGGGGGGGGYGANGGNGYSLLYGGAVGGGGGGYGAKGGDGILVQNSQNSSKYNAYGGGGGGYGIFGTPTINGSAYAAGGMAGCNGGNGVCILEYYVWE